MPKSGSFRNKNKSFSFPDPLNTISYAGGKGIGNLHPMPNLFVCLVLAFFKSLVSCSWMNDSSFIIWLCQVFQVVNRVLRVFHRKEGGQIGSVRWDPDQNTKLVTSGQNSAWGKRNSKKRNIYMVEPAPQNRRSERSMLLNSAFCPSQLLKIAVHGSRK